MKQDRFLGISEIDLEHAEIFKALEILADQVERRQPMTMIHDKLGMLQELFLKHTQREESLMSSLKISNYLEHKSRHAEILRKIIELGESADGLTSQREMNKRLSDTLAEHIEIYDMQIADGVQQLIKAIHAHEAFEEEGSELRG